MTLMAFPASKVIMEISGRNEVEQPFRVIPILNPTEYAQRFYIFSQSQRVDSVRYSRGQIIRSDSPPGRQPTRPAEPEKRIWIGDEFETPASGPGFLCQVPKGYGGEPGVGQALPPRALPVLKPPSESDSPPSESEQPPLESEPCPLPSL
ncbi:hypothetical protein EVAR_66553_1 [Eumeta japonica]|uniref:Uncharacterized protein n=1 Tax=Eumeta variegata TaxID=151549 RepID=A0A4C1ZDE6_EUMVA|nr:hypothetical protein EVAR_66553_1 [Eumeta japonica]